MTSVQLNLIMVCFLPLVWYNQLIMLPCFKDESGMPTVMKITEGVKVLILIKRVFFFYLYFNNIIP